MPLALLVCTPTLIIMKGVHARSIEVDSLCRRRFPHCPDMALSGPINGGHSVPTVSHVKVLICVSIMSVYYTAIWRMPRKVCDV